MDKSNDVDADALELDEKHVADDIEKAIPEPMSIEAEAMVEAAELEELKFPND
ncbi:MAG: hypothetical protein ACR2OI_06250 [Acidimicrobiia bacterium]